MALAAGTQQELEQRVQQCEAVLDQAYKAVDEQTRTIGLLEAQNDRLTRALDYETAQAAQGQAWYRDPKLIAPAGFALGLLAGVLLARPH